MQYTFGVSGVTQLTVISKTKVCDESWKYMPQCFLLHCFPTELPQPYEYIVDVEISTVDVKVLQQLKNILDNTSLPLRVSDSINITEVNITNTGTASGFSWNVCADYAKENWK